MAQAELSEKISVDAHGGILEPKDTVDTTMEHLRGFADEATRVAREVGSEGRLRGQARVGGVYGTWKRPTANVNGSSSPSRRPACPPSNTN
ncbi:hypothetical protein [Streptomyces sp. NBC_00401]|uniref:hypothetical protein n=1 Tax=Streptomyces sp. NBC_00401 TaxID=2975738 RepID=UPI002B1D8305|nr:hypothetical protein [Streptomyces sp. NBC_00401]